MFADANEISKLCEDLVQNSALQKSYAKDVQRQVDKLWDQVNSSLQEPVSKAQFDGLVGEVIVKISPRLQGIQLEHALKTTQLVPLRMRMRQHETGAAHKADPAGSTVLPRVAVPMSTSLAVTSPLRIA